MNWRNDAVQYWVYDRILRASLVLTSDLVSSIRAKSVLFSLESFAEASVNTKILEWCGVLTRASCTGEAQRETHFQENLEMFIELTNSGWLGYFCYPLGPNQSVHTIFTSLYKNLLFWHCLWDHFIFQSDMCVYVFPQHSKVAYSKNSSLMQLAGASVSYTQG